MISSCVKTVSPSSLTTCWGNGIESVYVRYASTPITMNPKTSTSATPCTHPLEIEISDFERW